ncbi:hypothetical protein D3C79_987380 [compost metagenome]
MLSGEGRAHHGQLLRHATRLAEEGKLKPLMDPHRFGLAQAQAAQVLQGSGKAVGKVVIDIE